VDVAHASHSGVLRRRPALKMTAPADGRPSAGAASQRIFRGSELSRQIAVDLESDADFDKHRRCPGHGFLRFLPLRPPSQGTSVLRIKVVQNGPIAKDALAVRDHPCAITIAGRGRPLSRGLSPNFSLPASARLEPCCSGERCAIEVSSCSIGPSEIRVGQIGASEIRIA
jgi:hypothetical protein